MGPDDYPATSGRRSRRIVRLVRASLAVTFAFLLVVSAAAAGNVGFPAGTATADSGDRVDVVFVFDSSDSMNSNRYEMAREMEAIDDRLSERDVDVRYALLTYEKSTELRQDWTDNYDDIDQAMNFGTSGDVEKASDAVLDATSMDFRDDAERVVVLVTDEDDDGSEMERDDARSALSGVHFVTVSPEDERTSSCEYHSEPCDDDPSNELRPMAQDVGGDWIDIGSSAESIVEDVGAEIETAATGSSTSATKQVSTSGTSSSLRVTDLTVNRSTAFIGQPVEIAATVENAGGGDGTFDALLADENGLIAKQSVEVPAGTVRTVRFTHNYTEPDRYELFVTHQYAGQVEVIPRPDTSVDTRVSANGSTLQANVSYPITGEPVTIPLGELEGPRGGVATLDSLTVTPADDSHFQAEVRTSQRAPNGTTPLPEHVRPVSYLSATTNTTLADGDNATTAFEYVAAIDEVGLYHYQPNGTGWTPLDAEAVNASSDRSRMVATSSGLSHFAIGVGEPAFEVADLDVAATSVDRGEPIEATAIVTNEGAAGGTYVAKLVADGDTVDQAEVFVPAGESRRVDLGFVRHAAGDVRLSVGGESETTVTVEDSSDADEEAASTSTTQESTTTESNGQPGFGAVVLVAALLLSTLVAIRRR